ncbi:MAG: enoyl-CoA hydratase family protein [Candidatus Krumholzibacteriota bacterium]|nr:enoyl-CoA hydratase family protein [Candidatus Krumholzibacteriota bacterium]
MRGSNIKPAHFLWELDGPVATITLNRPEKKNPLTFDSYAELRDTFRNLSEITDVKAVVFTGAEGNFSSGGDVHEIIAPLTKMSAGELRAFTAMTGDLIIAMLRCPQVIVAAIDGVCMGAGAAIAMASDIRFGTPESRVAFLFVRVGLAGCDMGACAMLPRIVGHGRAAELLYTGRDMLGEEAYNTGFYNALHPPSQVVEEARKFARDIATGPTVAHAMTKKMLREEWDMGVVAAVEAEAEAQAHCMETKDFHRAYEALVEKRAPRFEGD